MEPLITYFLVLAEMHPVEKQCYYSRQVNPCESVK